MGATQMICGFCADKNVEDCLRNILGHIPAGMMRLINSSHPRAMKAERLRDALRRANEAMGREWSEGAHGGRC